MHRRRLNATLMSLVLLTFVPMATTSARASGTLAVLYDFNFQGTLPVGNLVFDSAGNLYGTTVYGGEESPNCLIGCGMAFKASRSGGNWNFETIYSFTGGSDGGEPHGRLTVDSNGNLYGTTYTGGTVSAGCPSGCGTVFQLSPSGGMWSLEVIHSFAGSDGSAPWTGLTPDSSGNLYGTTTTGGLGGAGTIFELSSSGSGWTFSSLYALSYSGSQGEFPFSDLVIDESGNIYGATQQRGNSKSSCSNLCGTLFELSPSNGEWRFSLLHAFMGTRRKDGGIPWGALMRDSAGNIYGTTFEGGATCDCGTVFRLSQVNGKWKTKILHRFTGSPDGQNPLGGLTMDKAGNLYGTSEAGGTSCSDCGTLFRLTPRIKGSGWKYNLLYSFTGGADGAQPYAGVTVDASGNLYGTTTAGAMGLGTLFEFSLP